ncbi:hypothetical protein ABZ370_39375 [Streptomyces sp. NPDC005962]|uniref:hypothetical protein n=1 Tax=Streptomyces sp. NPDC005962 TaxID=3154466 RepID=UPI0033FD7121
MNIGKKVAALAVAAGALVLGSAAGASAHGYGGFDPFGAVQSNSCKATAGIIAPVGGVAPTGDINVGGDCLNYTQGTAAVQSNDCDSSVGSIVSVGAAGPTGDVNVGRNCSNIALGNGGGYGRG